MTLPRPSKTLATAFALGVGLGVPALALGQTNPNNANLSTGSGAGTSPGVAPGSSPSGTRTGTGRQGAAAPSGAPLAPGQVPAGRGIDPTTGLPAALDPIPGLNRSQDQIDAIDSRLLDDIRAIQDPADRAMGMERVAASKLATHQPGDNHMEDAEIAIREGGIAAQNVQDRVTRDIRLTNLVRTSLALADEMNREAKTDANQAALAPEPNAKPWTARRRFDWLVKAERQRQAAADLAVRIDNATLRGEMMFHVVDSTAAGSQEIQQQVLLVESDRSDLKGMTDMISRMADRGLVLAANTAARMDKPIWRDRAMVSIAIAAAASDQFERGVEIARTIPHPEYRADAMTRLAESQARDGLTGPATATYTEAAEAVASIRLKDPRATLAAVLIDSLISVGRFDDARECIRFSDDPVRRLRALSVIAENQGERGLADSAYVWINNEAPPELRDRLRLRVVQGVLKSFQNNRNLAPGVSMPIR